MICRPAQPSETPEVDGPTGAAQMVSGIATQTAAETSLDAALNFLRLPRNEKPAFHVHDRSKDRMPLVSVPISIRSARDELPDAALDVEGFCIVKNPRPQTDWDPALIKRWDPALERDWKPLAAGMSVHAHAIEECILAATGAAKAFVTPVGAVRIAERSAQTVRSAAHRPARFVHSDYSDASATAWAFMLLGPGWDRKYRCAVYNAWRVLTPPPQDSPLALCDARTVGRSDGIVTDAIQDYPGMQPSVFEATVYQHSESHAWYYYPDMTEDEVVLFKGFDSDPERACRVPHSAFDVPIPIPGMPARVSIDFRVLASFPQR